MTQIDEQAGIRADGERSDGLEVRIARELLEQARSEGISLVGPGGLLAGVTKTVKIPSESVRLFRSIPYTGSGVFVQVAARL